MPIYAYKCTSCEHEQDVLQKISDEPLRVCPACNEPSFSKQVTAAGFQLKGSGWYVTDFRDGGKKSDKKADAKPDSKTEASSAADSKPAESKADTKADSKADAKTESKPAAPSPQA
jgi:putative FmdB family regulatory protein